MRVVSVCCLWSGGGPALPADGGDAVGGGGVVDADQRPVRAPRAVCHVLLLHHPGLRDHQALEPSGHLQGQGALVTLTLITLGYETKRWTPTRTRCAGDLDLDHPGLRDQALEPSRPPQGQGALVTRPALRVASLWLLPLAPASGDAEWAVQSSCALDPASCGHLGPGQQLRVNEGFLFRSVCGGSDGLLPGWALCRHNTDFQIHTDCNWALEMPLPQNCVDS